MAPTPVPSSLGGSSGLSGGVIGGIVAAVVVFLIALCIGAYLCFTRRSHHADTKETLSPAADYGSKPHTELQVYDAPAPAGESKHSSDALFLPLPSSFFVSDGRITVFDSRIRASLPHICLEPKERFEATLVAIPRFDQSDTRFEI